MPTGSNGVCYEYFQDEDGNWCVNGRTYSKRIVLKGTMPMASCESEY